MKLQACTVQLVEANANDTICLWLQVKISTVQPFWDVTLDILATLADKTQ